MHAEFSSTPGAPLLRLVIVGAIRAPLSREGTQRAAADLQPRVRKGSLAPWIQGDPHGNRARPSKPLTLSICELLEDAWSRA